MSGIEKVCECPIGDCNYHGYKMYEYKKNSLQVNPECRGQFNGLTAHCVIVSMCNDSSDFFFARKPNSSGWESIHKDDCYKENGCYYTDTVHFYTLIDKAIRKPMQYGYYKVVQPYVVVYVKEHNKKYINWLDDMKSIRAFKRNMRKLFGYDIPIYQDTKNNHNVGCDDVADNLFKKNGVL